MAAGKAVPGTSNAFDPSTNQIMNTQRASGMPNIGPDGGKLAVATTNVDVFSNGMRIGFVQSFAPSESRTITKVQELGSEGVVQSVAGNTNGGQLTITRFAVYNANLWNALGLTRTGQFAQYSNIDTSNSTSEGANGTFASPFKTLKDQRVPLEIKQTTRYPGTTEAYYEITYLDCWLSSYSRTLSAQTITISESATIMYSDLLSNFTTNQ